MFAAVTCMFIGIAAVFAALMWAVLRQRRNRLLHRVSARVTGAVGRPEDDMRAMVLTFADEEGRMRTWTDTMYTSFALGMVGERIDVDIMPDGRVLIPRQSDPTLLLNVLLGVAGIGFFLVGIFLFTELMFGQV
ncbi:hypothetical protein [Corynebacterium sp.]|uniref:hypothetical protein n=1 Tax=Corynebacterium sp. TaxID=1720 RepID=UPI0026DC807C|nr:hypothetical protein [Corynebacterium sp.]MDO4611175.1 hypothetical protein [Corynebacterium sp.]